MSGATVTWASGGTGVATVTSAGLVTAVGNGTATITATAGSASGTAAVTVAQVVSAVAVSPGLTLWWHSETRVRLVAEVIDANGHAAAGSEFSWSVQRHAGGPGGRFEPCDRGWPWGSGGDGHGGGRHGPRRTTPSRVRWQMARGIGGCRGNGSQVTRTGTPVPDLHEEYEAGGGPITDRYVDGLTKIAAHAIPAIDKVEVVNPSYFRRMTGANIAAGNGGAPPPWTACISAPLSEPRGRRRARFSRLPEELIGGILGIDCGRAARHDTWD